MKASCRLCSQPVLREAFTLENSARNISHMLSSEERVDDHPVDVTVYECEACGFVQLTQSLAPGFYDTYIMTTSFSPQMQAYQKAQATDFVTRYGLSGKRLVELGCGDGSFLQRLTDADALVTGVEPSEVFRRLAVEKGFHVLPVYVSPERDLEGAPYDAFACREVLEHILDIHGFIRGIRRALRPGGAGLVQVPSLEQALDGGRFYDFFPDHLNYFSAGTLRLAFELNGFRVDEVSRGMNGEYLQAHVRLDTGPSASALADSLRELTFEIHRLIEHETRAGRRVAVWGAGGKGVTVLSAGRIADIAYIVDSDPNKQGRYTPVTHFPIVPPERLAQDPIDTVIVSAMAYSREIIDYLRNTLGFRGTIATLGSHLEIV